MDGRFIFQCDDAQNFSAKLIDFSPKSKTIFSCLSTFNMNDQLKF